MSQVVRTGVDNPWRDGDEPEPLDDWLAQGFTRDDAESWRGWRFMLREAQAWRRAGVTEALHAAQWSTARATPKDVGEWRAAGIEATEAVKWHEFGHDLASARREKARGHDPVTASRVLFTGTATGGPGLGVGRFAAANIPSRVMHSYLLRQWTDDEAVEWAKEHIDAADAQLWKELGVTPPEAGRAQRRGLTAITVVGDWWRAGIPIAEVADWLGAGLSAEEAAAQRAKGITAEQAAALRALRDEPDE